MSDPIKEFKLDTGVLQKDIVVKEYLRLVDEYNKAKTVGSREYFSGASAALGWVLGYWGKIL